MKILWITNVELPEIAEHFNRKTVVEGWLDYLSKTVSGTEGMELFVASRLNWKKPYRVRCNGICYYSFWERMADDGLRKIISDCQPDIIHIWGTEYAHSLKAVRIAEECQLLNRTVISVQGLVSVYAKHYYAGLSSGTILHRTFKEWLGRPNIAGGKKDFCRRGKQETEALRRARHCIGRTDWDQACARLMNPDICYHFCNEVLRKIFYDAQGWSLDRCERHTIFFSQATYPIKGFHYMLEALRDIRRFYPDVKVRVLGTDPLKGTLEERMRRSSYQQYLGKYIKKYNLSEHVEWQGVASAEQMAEHFCRANVFVCASSIENSSNSIGEAMLLGVPVVASDVGGIKSLLVHEKEGLLYQESAAYMLADCVMRIFADDELAIGLGQRARERARATHDPIGNTEKLFEIYRGLFSTCGKVGKSWGR